MSEIFIRYGWVLMAGMIALSPVALAITLAVQARKYRDLL